MPGQMKFMGHVAEHAMKIFDLTDFSSFSEELRSRKQTEIG